MQTEPVRVPLATPSRLTRIPERTLRSYRAGQRVPPAAQPELIGRELVG